MVYKGHEEEINMSVMKSRNDKLGSKNISKYANKILKFEGYVFKLK